MGYSGEVHATRVQSRAPGRARGEPKKLLTYTAARGRGRYARGGLSGSGAQTLSPVSELSRQSSGFESGAGGVRGC